MIDLQARQAMQKYYEKHFRDLVAMYPGYIVLLNSRSNEKTGGYNITPVFYKDIKELKEKDNSVSERKLMRIPKNTHRYNPGNKKFDQANYYVDVCPNGGTPLVPEGKIDLIWGKVEKNTATSLVAKLLGFNYKPKYENGIVGAREQAYCPDCKYQVNRLVSDRTLRRVIREMKK